MTCSTDAEIKRRERLQVWWTKWRTDSFDLEVEETGVCVIRQWGEQTGEFGILSRFELAHHLTTPSGLIPLHNASLDRSVATCIEGYRET